VKNGVQLLVPEVDWGFINVRHRELSEKAKANQAQLQGEDEEEEAVAEEEEEEEEEEDQGEGDQGGGDEGEDVLSPKVVASSVSASERRRLMVLAAEQRFIKQSTTTAPVFGFSSSSSSMLSLAATSSQQMDGKISLDAIIGNDKMLEYIVEISSSLLVGKDKMDDEPSSETAAVAELSLQHQEALLLKIADMGLSGFKEFINKQNENQKDNSISFSDEDVTDLIENVRSYIMDITMFKVIKLGFENVGQESEVNVNHILELLKLMNIETIRDLKLWTKHPAMFRNLLARKLPSPSASSSSSSSSSSSTSSSSNVLFSGLSKDDMLKLVNKVSDVVQLKWKEICDEASALHPWLDDWITGVVE
jgi:hypothetical protein